MTWTWDRIFTDALFRSGVLGQSEPVDATMLAQARQTANLLLDELDGEGVALPVFSLDVTFNTVTGQEKYLLGTGTGSAANGIRPETIVDAQLRLTGGDQPVFFDLVPMDFRAYREQIVVPKTLSQPINFAWNPVWPQGEFYLWPTPSQVWQVRLTAKVKWIDVVGVPSNNVYGDAELPSGYNNAFTNILALRLAENNRLDTDTLRNKAAQGKYTMATYTWSQVPEIESGDASAFPWNITQARSNW